MLCVTSEKSEQSTLLFPYWISIWNKDDKPCSLHGGLHSALCYKSWGKYKSVLDVWFCGVARKGKGRSTTKGFGLPFCRHVQFWLNEETALLTVSMNKLHKSKRTKRWSMKRCLPFTVSQRLFERKTDKTEVASSEIHLFLAQDKRGRNPRQKPDISVFFI